MALPKLKNRGGFYQGKVVEILKDLYLEFSQEMLDEILLHYNQGYSPEEISEYTKRDPDEIFLALFHHAREEKEIRAFAHRKQ